jgi:glutamyl-tRNA reductase
MKRAYESALETGLVRSRLSPLLNMIIREAKAIRSRVGLTQIHTSVATVAGQMIAHRKLNSVLMVGAGETNQTFGQYLKKRRAHRYFWCTRSDERAQSAISTCGGEQITWQNLKNLQLPKVDAICVATHSPDVLVNADVLNATGAKVVIDLAVPPNASRSDAVSMNVDYLGIDDLHTYLKASEAKSQLLEQQIRSEITSSLNSILSDWNNRKAGGFISEINAAADNILELEVDALLAKFSGIEEMEKRILEDWSRKLVKKINHLHFETLKRVLAQDEWSTPSKEERPHG